MGNLIQSSTPFQLQKRYKIIKESHQDLTLLQQHYTENEYCLKCFMFNSNQGLQACVQKLKLKKRINHQHILAIKQIYNRSQNTFCSNIYKVYAIIQFPFHTLSEQIIQRRRNDQYFIQTQLWSIIYSCSMALNYLYSTNLTHGCLTTNKIYIQKGGIIKISDPNLFNQNNNLITYMTNSAKQHVYVSPQQLTQINSNKNYNQNESMGIESSDVFVLGMVILEAIYLEGMEGIYDHGVHNKLLNERVSGIEGRYSQGLRNLVERMVVTRVEERISFEEIETIIENHNFDDDEGGSEESSRRGSLVSRRPLESIPSSANLQNGRKEDTKDKVPSQSLGGVQNQRQLVYNQNVYNVGYQGRYEELVGDKPRHENERYSYNQGYAGQQPLGQVQLNQMLQPNQMKKLDPLVIYSPVYPSTNNHPLPHNYNNLPPTPYTYIPTTSNYSPTSQYINNSYHLNTSINQSTNNLASTSTSFSKIQNIKPIDLPNYDLYPSKLSLPNTVYLNTPTATGSQSKYNYQQQLPQKVIEPIKVEYDAFVTPPPMPRVETVITQSDYNTKYQQQPLNFSKASQNSSPVERLKTIQQSQQLQRQQKKILHQHPNSVIAEVTQTQISGVDSPQKQSQQLIDPNAQPQYVNQDSQSGSHYQGYKLNGKKHGFGRLYYQDGGYYQGQWKFNKMNGFAKLFYQSGDIAYQGYWVNDKLHGKGKVFNDNPIELDEEFDYRDFTGLDDYWQFYDGEFAVDAKQGFGTIKLTNGEIFEGEFDKDVIEGRGKFYALNGKIITGEWKENKLVDIIGG